MPRPRAATPATQTCTFRVRILDGFSAPPGARKVWREIELRADQTLADLGALIPSAFGFYDDHLWSFFLSGKPWDRATEYPRMPDPDLRADVSKRVADRLRLRDAPAGREFLFLFDYGDEWHFGVTLARTGAVEPGARYPRVVAGKGEAPPQYPEEDEDDWDEEAVAEREALLDPSLFGPAKAMLATMQAEGVDLGDPDTADPPEFPPVELLPREQLREAAAATPTGRRLRALVEWVGDGRRLTANGNLTVADGKELAGLLGLVDPDRLAGMRVRSSREIAGLELVVAWAEELRLVRVRNARLVPVQRYRHLLDDPLELLSGAADVLPSLGHAVPLMGLVESAFPGGLAEALLDLLSLLYQPEGPVSLGDLADHLWWEHVEARILDSLAASQVELWRLATAVETTRLLSQLQGLGMVENAGEGGPAAGGITAGLDDEPGTTTEAYLSALARLPLRLTPLGTWRANVLLRALGAVVPVVGELAGEDAAALITGVAGYDERAYRAELRAWCAERGDAAARELAGYIRAASGFEQRMLAFAGLQEAGPAAEAEARAMLPDAALRPHAQLWLVENGFEDERSLDPTSATLLMTETLASILDTDGPAGLVEHLEQLGPPGEQAVVLGDLWRAQTPRAFAVLEAVGKAHPSASVAKAARKAAFKLRSSGGRG